MLSIRPRVASLNLQVFARALHPELFRVYRSHSIEREQYRAKFDITQDGHIITFVAGSVTLAEVSCATHQLLPQKRRLLNLSIGDRVSKTVEAPQGIRYRTECELECLSSEMFAMIQAQLASKQKELELLHVFDSSGRIAMGAISYLHLDLRPKSLTVRAIHTFPDEEAIVKFYSTFSLPKRNWKAESTPEDASNQNPTPTDNPPPNFATPKKSIDEDFAVNDLSPEDLASEDCTKED